MNQNGYFGIGCFNMRNEINYGTMCRTAHIMGASFAFVIGKRFRRQASDTVKSWRHMPDFDDFYGRMPYDSQLVGIEMGEGSRELSGFTHPMRCTYLLGAEDHGLPPQVMDSCHHVVRLPGEQSLNVAVAGSIVVYDRIAKGSK